jgi:radial spoke head protein 4/6
MGDWIQLPDAEPHQIVAARMIKKMLSGNLNAQIDSNPPFPGKERNLLRA